MVDILIESGKVPELVTHYFGNYSIQDLMEACFKLRKVARVMDFQASWGWLSWLSRHTCSRVRQLCMVCSIVQGLASVHTSPTQSAGPHFEDGAAVH